MSIEPKSSCPRRTVIYAFSGASSYHSPLLGTNAASFDIIAESVHAGIRHASMLGRSDVASMLREILNRGDSEWMDDAQLRDLDHIWAARLYIDVGTAKWFAGHGHAPDVVLGGCLGEIEAAVICGAITEIDALRIALAQSAALKAGAPGAMLVVKAPVGKYEDVYSRRGLWVAAENAEDFHAISGSESAIAEMQEEFRTSGVRTSMTDVHVAGHGPIKARHRRLLDEVSTTLRHHDPSVPWISTVTARPVNAARSAHAHWHRQLQSPIRFQASLAYCINDMSANAPMVVQFGPGDSIAKFLTNEVLTDEVSVILTQPDEQRSPTEQMQTLVQAANSAQAAGGI